MISNSNHQIIERIKRHDSTNRSEKSDNTLDLTNSNCPIKRRRRTVSNSSNSSTSSSSITSSINNNNQTINMNNNLNEIMDHSRRLNSIHFHQANALHQLQHAHQMNPNQLLQLSQHHQQQQQQQHQRNQLHTMAHQHHMSSLQNLINRHQQQQQQMLSPDAAVLLSLGDHVNLNSLEHHQHHQHQQQQQQEVPLSLKRVVQQQETLSLDDVKVGQDTLLLNSLNSHINLMGNNANSNQQQQHQQYLHAIHLHHQQQQQQQSQLSNQKSNMINQQNNPYGTGPATPTSLLNSNSKCAPTTAQSPNSTGCISDSCSRSSSSGTSSVSPQPILSNQIKSQQQQQQQQTINVGKLSTSNRKLSTSSTTSSLSSSATAATVASRALSSSNATSNQHGASCSIFELIPELLNDGLNLSWAHGINSRCQLQELIPTTTAGKDGASCDDICRVIAGDVSLSEISRYPLPIMARAPIGVSDLTLENWFTDLIASNPHRAIKLTFSTTRAVEPAFRVLARHADSFKGSLILNANILAHPSNSSFSSSSSSSNSPGGNSSGKQSQSKKNQQQQQVDMGGPNQPVDAWTFLMLCRTRFPRSTISIGWCQPKQQQIGTQSLSIMEVVNSVGSHHHQPATLLQLNNQLLTANNNSSLENCLPSMQESTKLVTKQASSSNISSTSSSPINIAENCSQLQHHLSSPYKPNMIQQSQSNNLINNIHHHHHHHHRLHPYAQQGSLVCHNKSAIGNSTRLLSSSASLNSSSSGHSSGSSSPTSPTGNNNCGGNASSTSSLSPSSSLKLATPLRNQQNHLNHSVPIFYNSNNTDNSDTSSVATAAATAAAAAALAAAVVAASNNNTDHLADDNYQQSMPLNLNINEADSSISSSGQSISNNDNNSSLSELAQRIQSYNQRLLFKGNTDNSLTATTNNYSKRAELLLKTTNNLSSSDNSSNSIGCYSREMIDKMAAIVKEYSLTQPITFPIEARFARNSLAELQRLLYQVGTNSSLTIIAQQDDLNSVSVDDLLFIRKSFAPNQVLYDLPETLASLFKQELAEML